MKRVSSDKTRFCVSHDCLSNGLETFCLPCFMFKNKTKNVFLNRRGSNILEPRLQYNGARAPIYWSPSNRLVGLKYVFAITQLRFNKTQSIWIGLIQLRKGLSMSHKIMFQIFDGLQYIGARAPLYWSLGSNILEPLRFKKHVFCFIFEHETRQTKGFQSIT